MSEQPAEPAADQPAGEQPTVPAGTQESPAAGGPAIAQDVEGRPVNIKLNEDGSPVEGSAPMGEDAGDG